MVLPMAASTIQSFGRRRVGTLKQAEAQLVEDVGGVERAATGSRLGKSRISVCASEHHNKDHLPVDVVSVLESVAGTMPVTSWLAADKGLILLDARPQVDIGCHRKHGLKVTKELADVIGKVAEALEDGEIDDDEAEAILQEWDEARSHGESFALRLRHRLQTRRVAAE